MAVIVHSYCCSDFLMKKQGKAGKAETTESGKGEADGRQRAGKTGRKKITVRERT